MKRLTSILVLSFLALNAYAQTEGDQAVWAASVLGKSKPATPAKKKRIVNFNFAPLWTRLHDNDSVFGYIGDNYQRLRIVILSATKQPGRPNTYNVTGKSMVKNVIRPFTGTITITQVGSNPESELDQEYKSGTIKESGIVFGVYHFAEDAKQTNTGKFDGFFVTYWVIDRSGRLQYDEVLMGSDSYLNNQFAGTWTSYRMKASKPASWGDSRIPVAGGLDIGAGEFSPDEQYVRNGWQGYRDAYAKQDKRALAEERRQWWK